MHDYRYDRVNSLAAHERARTELAVRFADPLDAILHAAYRATVTGQPWGVYDLGLRVVTAPLGRISAERLLETCHP